MFEQNSKANQREIIRFFPKKNIYEKTKVELKIDERIPGDPLPKSVPFVEK